MISLTNEEKKKKKVKREKKDPYWVSLEGEKCLPIII